MRKSKSTVVALSTVAALLATGGAAAAVATNGEGTTPASSAQSTQANAEDAGKGERGKRRHMLAPHAPKGDGAKALCKRAPKADRHIDRLQRRLDGGVRTRGSIERLERRADLARKAGHGVVADFLDERADDRRELKVRLKEREEGLKKVRAWCAKQDVGGSERKGEESGESGSGGSDRTTEG